jgi:hypothetical protein
MPKKIASSSKYENNPFFIAGNGITLLFNTARGVGVLFVVLSVLSYLSNGWSSDDPHKMANDFQNTVSGWSAGDWTMAIGSAAIIGLALAMIWALIGGVSAYTSYRLSRGETVNLRDAFRSAFDRLWSYLWLQAIIFVKLFLWTLLLVLPGIYMAFRYSLASVAFFDDRKNLRGNAAVKESLRLTNGAWVTTFAANTLFNILTFGALSSIVTTSVNAVLYRQFGELGDKKKPAAHWLSWVTLVLPMILFLLAVVFILGMVVAIVLGSTAVHAPAL